jgi:hypothetical protein
MTKGVVFFAHNNEKINYGLLAYWSSKRVRQHLKVGSSLVTDQLTCDAMDEIDSCWKDQFDEVIIKESVATQTKRYGTPDNQLTFHNLDRLDVWNLTPYDETIVLDVDLVIQTDLLSKLWESSEDLIVCDTSTDLYGTTDSEFNWVSDRSVKFYWATVFYFKKTEFTKLFFKQCEWIKHNYNWIRYVYELPSGPMRNDFVWSIALHSLNYSPASIPFNIMHSNFEDRIIDMNLESIKFLTDKGLCKIKSDVHVFNKFDLLDQIHKGQL